MSELQGGSRFWECTPLEELSDAQWESLCDGCGRCCLQKLEDIDTGEVFFTRVACHLLDTQSCRCSDYHRRFTLVPDCTQVRPLTAEKSKWLPATCAYRLVAEKQSLADWHPLISGDPLSVHEAGISVRGMAVSEADLELSQHQDYQAHIIHFDHSRY